MRRWLVLIGITAALALGLTVAAPPGAAQATACATSLTCNPANLPLLIEAGVVSGSTAGGVAATAPVAAVATTGTVGAVAKLGTSIGGKALGFLNLYTVIKDIGSALGVLDATGVTGQQIQLDPAYQPPAQGGGTTYCKGYATVDAAGLLPAPSCRQSFVGRYNDRTHAVFEGARRQVTGVDVQGATIRIDVSTQVLPIPAGNNEGDLGWDANNSRLYCRDPQGRITPGDYFDWWVGTQSVVLTCGGNGGTPYSITSASGTSVWAEVYGATRSPFYGQVWNVDTGLFKEPEPQTTHFEGEFRTTVTCRDSDGTTFVVEVVDQLDGYPGDLVDLPQAKCPPGSIATTGRVDWKGPDTQTWTPITEPIAEPAPGTTMPEVYPDCFVAGAACHLELWKKEPDGSLSSCGAIGELCIGWATQPSPQDRYQCKYGKSLIDIKHCSAYRDPTVGVLPNVGADGQLLEPSAPRPNPLPNPIRNPTTGEPVKLPDGLDNEQTISCVPKGNDAFNPISWVMQPVQCAIRWAFVPRQSVVDSTLGSIPVKLGQTTPGKFIAAIELWDFQTVSGCAGLRVDMSWIPYANVGAFYFMPACPGDFFATIAPLFKVFMYGSIAVSGYFAGKRVIGSFVGMGA